MMPATSPGTRVPLVLAIHGGPHSAYGTDFNFQFQWMAANGLAVLYTNPRGSTEYGEKFLWATWGGWGGLDYDDVMAGVDHALARYPVDPKRLAVTGLLVRRLPHQLDDHADTALRGGDGGRRHLELDQRLRHGRHPADEGERVPRHAVGGDAAPRRC